MLRQGTHLQVQHEAQQPCCGLSALQARHCFPEALHCSLAGPGAERLSTTWTPQLTLEGASSNSVVKGKR